MSNITAELPARLAAYLHPGAVGILMTVGEDGYATDAFSWIVAPDRGRVRFGVDHGSKTLANLQRDGRLALQVIGPDHLIFLVKGEARQLKARMSSMPRDVALWEMRVVGAKDQSESWPGVAPNPLTVDWSPEQREAMLQVEHAAYAEMRACES